MSWTRPWMLQLRCLSIFLHCMWLLLVTQETVGLVARQHRWNQHQVWLKVQSNCVQEEIMESRKLALHQQHTYFFTTSLIIWSTVGHLVTLHSGIWNFWFYVFFAYISFLDWVSRWILNLVVLMTVPFLFWLGWHFCITLSYLYENLEYTIDTTCTK